ncbi:DUF488 domain-containing protein [Streptacidiphilus cavernicola]|uniref:DUF488 domain-containing protein n=1 Tax=Streptacidiphilus cavernicola TaxID=3342716 RepID=A0ABV6VW32_9ACTN
MTSSETGFQVRRVYDPAGPDDGSRVLVDRLWPRGLSKQRAAVDLWLKEIAPSTEVRTRYHGGLDDFTGFAEHYRAELDDRTPAREAAVQQLLALAGTGTVTLVTSVKEVTHSHVPVLIAYLDERLGSAPAADE